MANQSEIIETIGTLADYYGTEPNEAQLKLYVLALKDLPPAQLEFAAAEWIKAGKWFPKVSELRELAGKYKEPAGDGLEMELYSMEDDFYRAGAYDAERLERIAVFYERAGRDSKAAWVREKSRRWRSVLEVDYAATQREDAGRRTSAGASAARPMASSVPAGDGMVSSGG